MSFVEDIKSRLKMVEDGTVVDNDDLRRLLMLAEAVEWYGCTQINGKAWGGGPEVPAHDKVWNIAVAIARNDMHALDALIDSPPHQEVKP